MARFCSPVCAGLSRGLQLLEEPLPARRCALPECGAVFAPGRDGQRCCCERHGKTLWNREDRRRRVLTDGET